MKINSLKKQKHGYLIHTWSDNDFKGTVVNRALSCFYRGSLEITRTVPLSFFDEVISIDFLFSESSIHNCTLLIFTKKKVYER